MEQSSQSQDGFGTWLAADVDDIVGVGKAVELRGGTLAVGAHVVKVQPVANVDGLVEAHAFGDTVDAVAGRTPDGVEGSRVGRGLVGSRGVVVSLSLGAQHLGNGLGVVKHDAREVAIDTIVQVQHVGLFAAGRGSSLDGAAGNDVAGNGEGGADVVSAGLGHDVHVAADGEELVESSVEGAGHVFKGLVGEAASNIESAHNETVVAGLLKDGASVADSLVETHGVRGTGANVEADTNNVEAQFLGKGQKSLSAFHGGTKLHAELADTGRVVGHDAQEQLGIGEELGNLVQLVRVVKGHLLDTSSLDVADVRVGLAWLSVDDVLGSGAQRQGLLDLAFGSAVKPSAETRKESNDIGVGVALDGIEGTDSRESLLPTEVLTVDLAEISYEESLFIASFAKLMVNSVDTLVKSLSNKLLAYSSAIGDRILKSVRLLADQLTVSWVRKSVGMLLENSGSSHNHG